MIIDNLVSSTKITVKGSVDEMNKAQKEIGGLILSNIPNILTMSRFILTFVVMYMIFNGENIWATLVIFGIAAATDFFDGQLARRFKWESEFGRKADMVADRFLWIGTALSFIAYFGIRSALNWFDGVQILMIMTREIISAPFVIVAFLSGNVTPKARYVAKVTTFIQGFALPTLILNIYYPNLVFISLPLAIICCVTGFVSALYYLKDIKAPAKRIHLR